jgi:hypothetical protein
MQSDDAPLIGGLFALGEALEAGLEVVFQNTYEPEPPEVASKRQVMARVLAASPACTHRGNETRN